MFYILFFYVDIAYMYSSIDGQLNYVAKSTLQVENLNSTIKYVCDSIHVCMYISVCICVHIWVYMWLCMYCVWVYLCVHMFCVYVSVCVLVFLLL